MCVKKQKDKMSNFLSTTKILNNVYSGDTLNVHHFGSTAEVLNMVYSETDNALRVNLSGYTGGGGTGTSGTSGTSGTAGTSGADHGTSGVDGTSGSSGVDGTSGSSGVDGTSGVDGVLSGITSDADLTFEEDVLKTPALLLTTDPGQASVFQMYNTSGVLYDVTIVGSTLTATVAT